MNNLSLDVFTDGGSRGNPGPAAIGVVVKNSQQQIIHQFAKTVGKATNNIAEYQAVIYALTWLNTHKLSPEAVNFFLDSSLVVNQLNGLWKVKDASLRTMVIHIRQLEGQLNCPICYTFIPREKNFQADALLNQALDNSLDS